MKDLAKYMPLLEVIKKLQEVENPETCVVTVDCYETLSVLRRTEQTDVKGEKYIQGVEILSLNVNFPEENNENSH
jgi:hypothetical protein